nr:unnamed protein product [Digitaria exilis]
MRPERGGGGVAVELMAAGGGGGGRPISMWRTPTPYLFLGFAFMMGLIAVALLVLICTRRKPTTGRRGPEDLEASARGRLAPLDREEPKFVVIMAGDALPSFLASARPLATTATATEAPQTGGAAAAAAAAGERRRRRGLIAAGGGGWPPSPWRTPTPYLFLALTAMMAAIVVALLVLVCTRRKTGQPSSSSSRRQPETEPDGGEKVASVPMLVPLDREEPKVVVIMAGERAPSFLATAKPLAVAFNGIAAAEADGAAAAVCVEHLYLALVVDGRLRRPSPPRSPPDLVGAGALAVHGSLHSEVHGCRRRRSKHGAREEVYERWGMGQEHGGTPHLPARDGELDR